MLNHCANQLTVTGPANDVAKFKKLAKSGKGKDVKAFDVAQFIPMPEILRHTVSGSRNRPDGTKEQGWFVENPDENDFKKRVERSFTTEELNELERIGHRDWYSWATSVWGTKWGTYDVAVVENGKKKLVYRYQTAWAPLEPGCWEQIAGQFPSLTFDIRFAEQGGAYYGRHFAVDGSVTIEESNDMPRCAYVDVDGNKVDPDKVDDYECVWPGLDDIYVELARHSG